MKKNKSKPMVSIMIPTYNQAALLPNAVESALAQDYPNIEIIVSDDASSDSTASVVAKYLNNPRIKYFRQPKNLGRSKNYETLLTKYAQGEWVLNLDGDDYLIDNTFIRHCVDKVAAENKIVMVVGGYQKATEFGFHAPELPIHDGWERINGIKYMLSVTPSVPLLHLAALYRREIGCKVGCYTDDILGADRQCLLLIAMQGDVLLTGRVVGIWRHHNLNQSSIIEPLQQIETLRTYTTPFLEARKIGVPDQILDRWRNRALAQYAVTYANACVAEGEWKGLMCMFRVLHEKYPKAFIKSVPLAILNWRLWAKIMLSFPGGSRLFKFARYLWHGSKIPN